jgi:hypothetical protein
MRRKQAMGSVARDYLTIVPLLRRLEQLVPPGSGKKVLVAAQTSISFTPRAVG